jgi:hypothetical protein
VPVPQLAFLLEASVAGSRARHARGRVDRQRGSWPGSANSVESKATFADAPPTIGAGFARSNGWPLVDAREPWPRDNLQLISQKTKSRRGDPIHPASLAGPQPLRRTQRGSKRIYEIAETGTRYCTDAFMSCCEAACELRQPDPGWPGRKNHSLSAERICWPRRPPGPRSQRRPGPFHHPIECMNQIDHLAVRDGPRRLSLG